MGKFLFRIHFKAVHPKSSSGFMCYTGVKCSVARSSFCRERRYWCRLRVSGRRMASARGRKRPKGVWVMFINSSMGRTGVFGSVSRMSQGINSRHAKNAGNAAGANQSGGWMNAAGGAGGEQASGVSAAKSMAEKRRMLSRDGDDEQDKMSNARSALEQSFSYAESLRKARMQKKSTSNKLKKLRYSYKSISSQLIRSKTSVEASKVARKARRQLVMLKGKRLHENEKYDSYELEAAIAHAQAMVRVARKKVKHLQEEELMKVRGGLCEGELEENKELENELSDEERAYLERMSSGGDGSGSGSGMVVAARTGNEAAGGDEMGNAVVSEEDMLAARQEQMQAYEEAMRQADLQEEMRQMELQRAREASDSMMDSLSELNDDMSDSMSQLLEELGLLELAEDASSMKVETDPADYKMMKLKHRLEEMRAIAEADAEYLKAMFNKFEKAKEATSQAASAANSANRSPAGSGSGGMVIAANTGSVAPAQAAAPVQAQAIDVVSAPDAVATVAAAPVEGGCVDVSL